MFTKKVIVTPKGEFSPEYATIYKNQIVISIQDGWGDENETHIFDIAECYEKEVPIFVVSNELTFEEYENWLLECEKWHTECSVKARQAVYLVDSLENYWEFLKTILEKIENRKIIGSIWSAESWGILEAIIKKYQFNLSAKNDKDLDVYGFDTQILIDYLIKIAKEKENYGATLKELLKQKPHLIR